MAEHYYGPFVILECIGKVAYRLELPPESKLHPVFHVSPLKPFHGEVGNTIGDLPNDVFDGHLVQVPLMICDLRTILVYDVLKKQILVQWDKNPPKNSTRENQEIFNAVYLYFHLEDKVFSEDPGSIMLDCKEVVLKQNHVGEEVDDLASIHEARPKRESKRPKWQDGFVLDY